MRKFSFNFDNLPACEAVKPPQRMMKIIFDDPQKNLPFGIGQGILQPGKKVLLINTTLSLHSKMSFGNISFGVNGIPTKRDKQLTRTFDILAIFYNKSINSLRIINSNRQRLTGGCYEYLED